MSIPPFQPLGSRQPDYPNANYGPPGGGVPPGYPPYSPETLAYGDASLSPPMRTSATAIISLIVGLLWCVPIISGLLATIFGIIGIRATRSPLVRGRALAIAGLCLGILGLLGWGGFATTMVYQWHVNYKPQHQLATTFLTDLSTGDVAGAQKLCGPGVTTAQLAALSPQMKHWGTWSTVSFNANSNTAGHQLTETYVFTTGGTQTFAYAMSRNAAGGWQIDSFTCTSVTAVSSPTATTFVSPTTLP